MDYGLDHGIDPMTTTAIRRPAVAGYYYPADPQALREVVDVVTQGPPAAGPARALIVPHGSYRQSGAVAGAAFARTTIPRRCIVLGPSHTGSWMPWSLMASGAYRTPLGDVPIDERCAEALRARAPFLEPDAWAQRGEHAIEVLLPFLQRRGPADLTVVPIIIGSADPAERLQAARALAQVIRMQEEPVLLIGSSDLSHYEPQARGAEQDRRLLEALCALDGPGLVRRAQEESIAMCGADAAACVLEAATELGASAATVAQYGTSADADGDPHSVTGYAGILIH